MMAKLPHRTPPSTDGLLTSRTILALDPGETTGYVLARWTRLAGPYPAMLYWGQWKGMDDLHSHISLFSKADVCVVESYRVYPGTVSAHTTSDLYTAREIGRIEWICHLNNVKLVLQNASKAKQTWPNQRLRRLLDSELLTWPVPLPSPRQVRKHTFDAIRHLMTYMEWFTGDTAWTRED